MTLALPILDRSPVDVFEPAYLAERPEVEVAEFHRGDQVLCIEPISGHWAVCERWAVDRLREQLLLRRRQWQLNPVSDEEAAPPASVTVPLKNKHCNLLCDYCFAESTGRDHGYPPPQVMLRFIRLVEELHPDRLRIFVFHGGETLIDWDLIDELMRMYRGVPSHSHGK